MGFYVAGSVFYSSTAFLEPLVAEFGWTYTQVSFAASLRGLEMGIFAPFVGIFVDRYGSRAVIFVGSIIVGFGLILLSMTNSLLMFYGAYLLVGLGAGGCTSVVVMTAVANWFDRKASLALGLAASGFGAGGLLVPVIVWMIDNLQWRTTLFILGLGAWCVCIPLSLVIRDKPEEHGYLPDGEEPDELRSNPIVRKPDGELSRKAASIPFRTAIRDKNFWYFNLAEAIRMMVVVSVIIHVMPYLSSVGIARTTAGMVTATLAVFSVAGRICFGYLGDIFDKRYVMTAAYTFMNLGLIVFSSFIKGTPSLLLFLILFAPGFGGGMTMRASLLREYYGTSSYGKILGAIMGTGSMAAVIGPTLAGWVYDNLGSYQPLWIGYVGLIILAIILLLRLKPLKAR